MNSGAEEPFLALPDALGVIIPDLASLLLHAF